MLPQRNNSNDNEQVGSVEYFNKVKKEFIYLRNNNNENERMSILIKKMP